MLNARSNATAAVCAAGLAVAILKPHLTFLAQHGVPGQLAVATVELGEPGSVIGDIPVSVVTSNFDLAATNASDFGDTDPQ